MSNRKRKCSKSNFIFQGCHPSCVEQGLKVMCQLFIRRMTQCLSSTVLPLEGTQSHTHTHSNTHIEIGLILIILCKNTAVWWIQGRCSHFCCQLLVFQMVFLEWAGGGLPGAHRWEKRHSLLLLGVYICGVALLKSKTDKSVLSSSLEFSARQTVNVQETWEKETKEVVEVKREK